MSHMFPELEQELSSVGADLDADFYPTFGSQSHALSVSSITGIFIFTRTDIIHYSIEHPVLILILFLTYSPFTLTVL